MSLKGPICLSWEEVIQACNSLCKTIENLYSPSDKSFNMIVGISRGGLFPGLFLSHQLELPNLEIVKARITTSELADSIKFSLPQIGSFTFDIVGKKVLLIDDIVGSGTTISLVNDLLMQGGAAQIIPAAMLQNVSNASDRVPKNLLIGNIVTRWVIFPWEQKQSY